jgi:hypothetical protein
VDAFSHNPLGKAKANYDFFEEMQDVKLVRKLGIQTWIGRKNVQTTKLLNLFMVEPLVDTMLQQETKTKFQVNVHKDETRIQSPIMKKRRPTYNKNMCWELAIEIRSMVDDELFNDGNDNI